MLKILKRIREQLLNTPEKYWVVVRGYHLHKSFWGTLLIMAGIIWQLIPLALLGVVLILLSLAGHVYTNNKPYFKLWDKVKV